MTTSTKRANPKKKGVSTKKDKREKDDPKSTKNGSPLGSILSIFLMCCVAFLAVGLGLQEQRRRKEGDEARNKIPPAENDTNIPLPRIPDNPSNWTKADPNIAFFLNYACRVSYCHPDLKAVRRSFRATREIPPGEVLFEIPRSLQIWDLDALRDPFIQDELFEAVHHQSGNVPGSEAFLAVYLALQMKRARADERMDTAMLAYLDILPRLEDPSTVEDWRAPTNSQLKYHPILIDAQQILGLLGHSQSHAVLQAYRNMVMSEYEAFSSVSPPFAELISQKAYFEARLNVLTRAIRVGPPDPADILHDHNVFVDNEQPQSQQDWLQDELEAYRDLLGIDLMKHGCVALIPVADLFNHHPNNNVEYVYQRKHGSEADNDVTRPLAKGSFVVRAANRPIENGFEPMVSYGTMSDAHLYGRYGFVNGDGSGHTQISIAFHHEILRLNISSQYDYLPSYGMTTRFRSMLEEPVSRYLRFDDGYEDCIPGPTTHPKLAELKRLKWQHLMRIANDVEKWTFWVSPRLPDSLPAPDISKPIMLHPPQYMQATILENYEALEQIRQTCRLMSLINSDYNGRATEVLTANLDNATFVVEKGNDALEFRSLLCMARWTGTGVVSMEQNGKLQAEFERVKMLNNEDYGSTEWHAYHIRFAEMQTLQALTGLIFAKVNEKWLDKKKNPPTEYIMRDQQCADSTVRYLFEEPESQYSQV